MTHKTHALSMRFIGVGILIAVIFSFASCNPVLKLGRIPTALPAFVQLKDSTVIPAKEAGQEYEFAHGRILADEQAFPSRKVLRYSNGEQLFMNLGNGHFGPQIAEGKINVFAATNAAHYGYSYHDFMHLYVQDSGKLDFHPLKLSALKHMIPPNDPANKYLNRFRQTRMILNLIDGAGGVCMVAGILQLSNAVMKNSSDATIQSGMSMVFAGAGAMVSTYIPYFLNKIRLKKAIAVRNGVFSQNR